MTHLALEVDIMSRRRSERADPRIFFPYFDRRHDSCAVETPLRLLGAYCSYLPTRGGRETRQSMDTYW